MKMECFSCRKEFDYEIKNEAEANIVVCSHCGKEIFLSVNQNAQNVSISGNDSGSVKARHGFTTFWLFFGLIVNSIVIILMLMFANIVSEYIGFSRFDIFLQCILSLAVISGYILLLKWKKIGFKLIIASIIIDFIIYFIMSLTETGRIDFDFFSILTSAISPVILWFVLGIRKNGKSAWEQME
ncbi:MAG: hypothetical protein FWD13_12710 [Treponema sp.]|nr:hypothetical protein [Treponema sp.]